MKFVSWLRRLLGIQPKFRGAFFVDASRVNLDDLIEAPEGYLIVRCHSDPRDCMVFVCAGAPDGQA
jgi:hypothetical protein